jgi:phosphatidylinositol 4-kinase A
VDPSIAVHLTTRFRSPKLHNDVRYLLLKHPDKPIKEPEALPILLGGSLPSDVSWQLKVFLIFHIVE